MGVGGRPFEWLSDDAFCDRVAATTRAGDRLVLLALRFHDLEPGGQDGAFPGYRRLARLTGLSPDYVRQRLSAMTRGGVLSTRRRGRYAAYFLRPVTPESHTSAEDDVCALGVTLEGATCDRRVTLRDSEEREETNYISDESEEPMKEGRTWLTGYLDDWRRAAGGEIAPGRVAKAFDKLHKAHGEQVVRQAWQAYLAATTPQYAAPEAFASRFGTWNKAPRNGGTALEVVDL